MWQKAFDGSTIDSTMEDVDIMTCNTCSARACVRCDRPMHDGETCAAYQARIKDRLDEEDKALKAVRRVSRPCPMLEEYPEGRGVPLHVVHPMPHQLL